MGNPDLQVDLQLLAETATELGLLIEEFDKAGEIAGHGEDAVGSSEVRSSLHGFVDNWSVHRKDLLGAMQAVYKMAWQGHDAYQQVDRELAKDIQVDVQHGGGHK